MSTYLALTIGPVYQTISQARKTRELWAGSYIFSVLARELIKAFQQHQIGDLISPKVPLDKAEIRNGAGIFPDRCYFKIGQQAANYPIKGAINDALDQVGNLIWGKKNEGEKLKPFFRIYAAEFTLNDQNHSVIQKLNDMLDALELQPLVPTGERNLMDSLEENIHNLYADSIFESTEKKQVQIAEETDQPNSREGQSIAFKSVFIRFDHGQQRRLPSILELATRELRGVKVMVKDKEEKEKEKGYDDIITEPTNDAILLYQQMRRTVSRSREEKLILTRVEAEKQEAAIAQWKSSKEKVFKFRHKYICFVKADGDSVGKTIGAIGNNMVSLTKFSSLLASFAQEAVNRIVEYDGLPIYAGGDDLFFLAPIQNNRGQHIFDLIQGIDNLFPSFKLQGIGKAVNSKFDLVPTLSYGISISYYKYPMFESMEEVNSLLFQKAKELRGKNAVAFRVLKHSGQAFGSTIRKKSPITNTEPEEDIAFQGNAPNSFALVTEIINLAMIEEGSFLTSVMHKLNALQPLLSSAIKNNQTSVFFKNHFNEPVHTETSATNYLNSVRELCEALWAEEQTNNPELADINQVMQQVYAILRLIQFLNQEDHD